LHEEIERGNKGITCKLKLRGYEVRVTAPITVKASLVEEKCATTLLDSIRDTARYTVKEHFKVERFYDITKFTEICEEARFGICTTRYVFKAEGSYEEYRNIALSKSVKCVMAWHDGTKIFVVKQTHCSLEDYVDTLEAYGNNANFTLVTRDAVGHVSIST